jgi:hypothetical protein
LQAARDLGWSHLAVVFTDDDPVTAAGFSIADNRTAELAEWDGEALARLLGEIRVEDERLQRMFDDLAEAEHALATDAETPEQPNDFPEVEENIETEHCCLTSGVEAQHGRQAVLPCPYAARVLRLVEKVLGTTATVSGGG